MNIAEKVSKDPHRQKKRLIMSRNDYMVEEENKAFYQVEYNLIASSLSSICEGARVAHNVINRMTGVNDSNTPEHLRNTQIFIEAFKAAHKAYGKPEAVIVALVDTGSSLFDHIFMQDDLELSG